MRVNAAGALLVLAGAAVMGLGSAGPAGAQAGLPRVIAIDKVTCRELLSSPTERADSILIFFNGYVNGVNQRTTWDERLEGEMINRVMTECQASPAASLLGVFTRASRR